MKIEDREGFGEIKAALLAANFEPIPTAEAHARNYPVRAKAALMPKAFDEGLLHDIVSAHTIDAGVIVETADLPDAGGKAQRLIMEPGDANELKGNLRTGTKLNLTPGDTPPRR